MPDTDRLVRLATAAHRIVVLDDTEAPKLFAALVDHDEEAIVRLVRENSELEHDDTEAVLAEALGR